MLSADLEACIKLTKKSAFAQLQCRWQCMKSKEQCHLLQSKFDRAVCKTRLGSASSRQTMQATAGRGHASSKISMKCWGIKGIPVLLASHAARTGLED